MVRTLRALFLFCLLSPAMISGVKAQRILGGVSLGMNLTQVDGDE